MIDESELDRYDRLDLRLIRAAFKEGLISLVELRALEEKLLGPKEEEGRDERPASD